MSSRPYGSDPEVDVITVTRGDDWFVARDESTGVASQGKTKPQALANLAEALELHEDAADFQQAIEVDRSGMFQE